MPIDTVHAERLVVGPTRAVTLLAGIGHLRNTLTMSEIYLVAGALAVPAFVFLAFLPPIVLRTGSARAEAAREAATEAAPTGTDAGAADVATAGTGEPGAPLGDPTTTKATPRRGSQHDDRAE